MLKWIGTVKKANILQCFVLNERAFLNEKLKLTGYFPESGTKK